MAYDKHVRANPNITSGTLRCTSPRRPQVASRNNMALLALNTGNNNMLLLTPCVLLLIPSVIVVDVTNREDIDVYSNIDSNNELSIVLSDARSTGGGKLIPVKGMTVVDVVEGEYAPLPNDYTFTYSATGNNSRGGDDRQDDDDLDGLIDAFVTDEVVSKYNFFDSLAHYKDGQRITNDNRKAVELTIFAKAGTYIRGLDPMKRVKQEEIFCIIIFILLPILMTINSNTSRYERLCFSNTKVQKRGGVSLPQLCIASRRQILTTFVNLLLNSPVLVTCLNCQVDQCR
jgi:hypothetical protein